MSSLFFVCLEVNLREGSPLGHPSQEGCSADREPLLALPLWTMTIFPQGIAREPPGSQNGPKEPKHAHCVEFGLEPPTVPREDPQEKGKKESEILGGLGKGLPKCEGGVDVVGVDTPLVRGGAQAFHDDQVVELRVQLGVQEVEGKDREEQVEVERERRVKEVRSWMTMEMK